MSNEVLQKYVERRVRDLVAEGLTNQQIVQQLEAVSGKKIVRDELQKQRPS